MYYFFLSSSLSIILYTGKPGEGKSLTAADKIRSLIHRNIRWYRKSGEVRVIATNLNLSKVFTDRYPGFFKKWEDVAEVCSLTGADIVWDEVANQMDSSHWQLLPLDVKVFLREHEKRGCDIYATTQNFPAVDVQFRRLVTELIECRKVIGSPRPGPCKPPVRHVWGLVWLRLFDPDTYDTTPEPIGSIWSYRFVWMSRDLVDIFDTLQSIPPGKFPPLRHMERNCPTCLKTMVMHQ